MTIVIWTIIVGALLQGADIMVQHGVVTERQLALLCQAYLLKKCDKNIGNQKFTSTERSNTGVWFAHVQYNGIVHVSYPKVLSFKPANVTFRAPKSRVGARYRSAMLPDLRPLPVVLCHRSFSSTQRARRPSTRRGDDIRTQEAFFFRFAILFIFMKIEAYAFSFRG